MNQRNDQNQPRMCWWQGSNYGGRTGTTGGTGGGKAGWRYPCGLCNATAVIEPGGLCEACSPTVAPSKRTARKPSKRTTAKTRTETARRASTKTSTRSGSTSMGRGRSS